MLLIDADLRRPSVAEYLGLEGRVGLTTVLIGKASVDGRRPAVGRHHAGHPAGRQVPPNPSELLGSPAMSALLDRRPPRYDMVLIDSPPVLPVTDAAVLGRQVDGALIIAGVDRIHRPQLREALDSLETAGCTVLGLVINKIARREVGAYVYERGYYGTPSTIWGEQAPAAESPAGDPATTAAEEPDEGSSSGPEPEPGPPAAGQAPAAEQRPAAEQAPAAERAPAAEQAPVEVPPVVPSPDSPSPSPCRPRQRRPQPGRPRRRRRRPRSLWRHPAQPGVARRRHRPRRPGPPRSDRPRAAPAAGDASGGAAAPAPGRWRPMPPIGDDPADPFRILCVCTGNICRSPATERLLAYALGTTVDVASAGTYPLIGRSISPPMDTLIAGAGADPDGFLARGVTAALLQEADLVLAMTRDHRRAIEMAPAVVRRSFTLREFARLVAAIDPATLPGDHRDSGPGPHCRWPPRVDDRHRPTPTTSPTPTAAAMPRTRRRSPRSGGRWGRSVGCWPRQPLTPEVSSAFGLDPDDRARGVEQDGLGRAAGDQLADR